MSDASDMIAQAGKLVRLRALRRDVAARALARARATLAVAEQAVALAMTARDVATTAHKSARDGLSACRGSVDLHLAHVAGRLDALSKAGTALAEAETSRDAAIDVARDAARRLARLTARHDQLATRHRGLRLAWSRAAEARAADEVDVMAARRSA